MAPLFIKTRSLRADTPERFCREAAGGQTRPDRARTAIRNVGAQKRNIPLSHSPRFETAADFVLMDETHGRRVAVGQGIAVKGTLGVFEDAASNRLIDLPEAIRLLRQTNVFLADHVVQAVLERHRQQQRGREE